MNSQHHEAMPAPHDATSAAPGRDALVHALAALYKERKPRQFDNPNLLNADGEDPLDAICVWQRAEPVPHWHYVTLGFSELYAKRTGNPFISGFGFELTFRLASEVGASEPPIWPMHLLQSLARYVFKSGNGFHAGHRLSTNGPISLGSPTALCALGFAFDPELPAIDTPNGHLAFLQVIGLTDDEERAAQQWDTRKLLDLLLPAMPLWITDLRRPSQLIAPGLQATIAEAVRQDGSSCVGVHADALNIKTSKRMLRRTSIDVTLGARQIAQLAELLPLRLPFGRPFTLSGPRWKLQFQIAKRDKWVLEPGVLKLFVTPASVQEFATLLHPHQGVYKLPAFQNIRWDVLQTTIRNPQGDIVDIVGADRRQRPRD
ncbi:MAG: suppressor of fused domain protein [Pseudomonadota bacterium]